MSLESLPYEQTDWNTETRESDQKLDATDFNENDTLLSTGTAWVGKSVSEMKTLLGLPTGRFACRFQVSTDDLGETTVYKSVPDVNTASYTTAITIGGAGTYTVNIPVSSTSKRLVRVYFHQNNDPTYYIRFTVNSGTTVTVNFYNAAGTLAHPTNDTTTYFYLDMEWY